MTRKELNHVLFCLMKVRQPNEHVNEAIALVKRDIARLNKRSKEQIENMKLDDWDYS